jgi:hypothetical protein
MELTAIFLISARRRFIISGYLAGMEMDNRKFLFVKRCVVQGIAVTAQRTYSEN